MKIEEMKMKIDQVMDSITGVKTAVEANNEKVGKAFLDKSDLFLSDMRGKRKLIESKKAELENELETLVACESSMKEMYSDVVAANDKEETMRLEDEMRKILTDIAFCKSKINLLEQQKVKGEKSLYDEAGKAYQKYLQTCEMGRVTISETEELIKDVLSKLEDIKRSMRYIGVANYESRMIEVYEGMNGPIQKDVLGNVPYHDVKSRFISSQFRNFM